MEVQTKTMGTVDVDDEHIITFPNGLFGFEDYHKYALIEAEYEPFFWLQSLDERGLAFIVVDPFLIAKDYELDVDDKMLAEIELDSPSDVAVFAIVTVPATGGPVTANLQGPLVINRKNQCALQVILPDSRWTTKHNIIKALKEGKV
mgnify:CR=1 FL=1